MDCGIAYCNKQAVFQVEIQGFAKQYMCEHHTTFLYGATKESHWYGAERLV